ncbi:MAG TPA: hypothetical protein VIY28_13420 [Pseudonocardiaceae bacterium]
MILTPPTGPALPDDDDPAVHAGHVNVLADELARLFGLVPLAVREQAAQAALEGLDGRAVMIESIVGV